MRIDHYHYLILPGVTERLAEISQKLDQVLRKENTMSQELDDLTQKVEANAAVDQSAIVLLEGLKAKLDEAGTDPAKLKALSDSLGSQQQQLADAITANTPAAPNLGGGDAQPAA